MLRSTVSEIVPEARSTVSRHTSAFSAEPIADLLQSQNAHKRFLGTRRTRHPPGYVGPGGHSKYGCGQLTRASLRDPGCGAPSSGLAAPDVSPRGGDVMASGRSLPSACLAVVTSPGAWFCSTVGHSPTRTVGSDPHI